jgi:hypothetical protein
VQFARPHDCPWVEGLGPCLRFPAAFAVDPLAVCSSPIGRNLALCVGQASSTISATAMRASRAIEMAAPRVTVRPVSRGT